ncbi:MAG TPA: biotin synthase BioB [Chloroflexota bacterium]|nr:biotin synthase BioB [Chloroflexota bacterium]
MQRTSDASPERRPDPRAAVADDPVALLAAVERQLLEAREPLRFEQAVRLIELDAAHTPALVALAHRVRLAYCGPDVELESLLNAKSGGCSEDCAFCSQAARHHSPIATYAFLDVAQVTEAARRSEADGASHFCIVVAVRGPGPRLMAEVLEAVASIQRATRIKVSCSLGLLTAEQARQLADAGVEMYNHNLEACRSFFPTICTTHAFDDRVRTCQLAKEAGMELCSGGILGMGEAPRQRVELAYELRALDPDEIPINFLNPRPNTPLADRSLLAPLEALRGLAVFRLVFPDKLLRYAGGREVVLRDLQAMGLLAGANGLIVGNYLTTVGRDPAEDRQMLVDLEMPVKRGAE